MDLLDRTKTGIRLRLLNGAIPVHVPEGEIRTALLGVIDGPVRVIRDEWDVLRIKAIGLEFSTESFYTYYCNGHISPMEAKIPFDVHKVVLDISFYWAYDLNEAILGSTFRDPANPKGIQLDGKPDRNLEVKRDHSYFTVAGPRGGMVEAMIFHESLAPFLRRFTLFRDDPSLKDPPEDNPGQFLTGFWVVPIKYMPKGTYRWWLYHYYPYPFSERKEIEVLNLAEHPVQISARPLPLPAGGSP